MSVSYKTVPYLFSSYQTLLGFTENYEYQGQVPAPSNITDFAGLFTGDLGINWNTPAISFVQAVFLNPSDGLWHYGGFGGSLQGSNWVWDDLGAIGPAPQSKPSAGVTGFCQAQAAAVDALGGGFAPPSATLVAACAQGSTPGDFNLVGFSNSNPISTWTSPWAQPINGPNFGGTTISAGSLLAGYGAMWVYGPYQASFLNGTGFIVGFQGSAADGSGPGPVNVVCLHTEDSADFGQYVYSTWPTLPAPSGGTVGAGTSLACTVTGGEMPVSTNTQLYAWQPNGDGTYSPWALNPGATSWVKLAVSLDVMPCPAGGFSVSGDNTTLYVVGYSKGYGCNVVFQIDIATLVASQMGGAGPSNDVEDGFLTTYGPNYSFPFGSLPGLPPIPVTQLGKMVEPVAAIAPANGPSSFNVTAGPMFIDIGVGTYDPDTIDPITHNPSPYYPIDAGWLRYATVTFIEFKGAQLAPLRMFQRSDSFGVRQFQLSGSANSPLSVRSQSAGATHV